MSRKEERQKKLVTERNTSWEKYLKNAHRIKGSHILQNNFSSASYTISKFICWSKSAWVLNLHRNQAQGIGKNRISSTRSVFFCGQITILFFPVPILYTLHTRRPSCVNSKLCRLLILAILLISRGEFCSWTMHTEAVTPLTGLSFNAVACLWQKQHHGLRCSIS